MDNIKVEVTDLFGGEANYSWVRRYNFLARSTAPTEPLIRKAKSLAGFSGIPSRTEDLGGSGFAIYPRGHCVVIFVTWDY